MKGINFLYRKFYSYLLKELVLFFFLSLIVFTFILVISRLGQMADFVINRGVDLKDILLLIVYTSPPILAFTLPMSFLLCTVVTLGRLSNENEILVLKANGIDLKYLFVPIAMLGIVIMVVGFLNTSLAISKSTEALRATYFNILKKGISFEDKEGVFNDSIQGIVIYIDKVNAGSGNFRGIIISDDREEQKGIKQTFMAESGSISVDSNTFDLTFDLKNGSAQRWDKQTDTFSTFSFKNHVVAMNLKDILGLQSKIRKKSSEMSIEELKALLPTQNSTEKAYDINLEIAKKFSIPCSVIAFALLCVPLGIKRKTEGKFSGVVYSLVIFIVYYILTAFGESVGKTYQIPPFLIAFSPNIIFSLLGLYLLRNLNKEDQTTLVDRLKGLWEPHFAKAE
jgi:LPS export ABC transporter permease LptF